MNRSEDIKKLLKEKIGRISIINQGEIYNKLKNDKNNINVIGGSQINRTPLVKSCGYQVQYSLVTSPSNRLPASLKINREIFYGLNLYS